MFRKILHANDGSEHAFHALSLALAIARQNNSELHMVCVEEIDYMPEFIEEVREETGTAARRFHKVLQRARAGRGSPGEASYPCPRRSSGARHRRACRSTQGRTADQRGKRPCCDLRATDPQPGRPPHA